VDPLKDRQAEKLAVDAGFKSRSDVVEAEGSDPEENDNRIAADKARAEALGLDFSPKPAGGGPPPDQQAQDDAAQEAADQAAQDAEAA
jgi:capsid protein